jgi:hypothetical protein
MAWGIWLLIGLSGGVGGSIGVAKLTQEDDPDPLPPVVVDGSKVGNKLADIDLVKVPCSIDFIKEHGDLLCRELFCRMQQRGLDSKTSQTDCAGISNMNNTLLFIDLVSKHCEIAREDTDAYNKCYQRFSTILTTGKSGG